MGLVLWKKVINDLRLNKTRTCLVVLSIFVGVFAIGAIVGSHLVFSRDLKESFSSVIPANITMFSEPFDKDTIEAIRKIRGVQSADGRRTVAVRLETGQDQWKDLYLTVIPDYEDIRVNKLKLISGTLPPPERGILLEKSSLELFACSVGDQINVLAPDGKKKQLKISGIVHDVSQIPSFFSGALNGYITIDALEVLGEDKEYDTVLVRTKADLLPEELTTLSKKVWSKLEDGGRKVFWSAVLPLDEHPLKSIFEAIIFLLAVMGILALLLSGFLLVNTILAILNQQIRQVGIMKALGASRWQIFKLYSSVIFCYCIMALLLAIPLGAAGARLGTFYEADLANIEIKQFHFEPGVVALQCLIALIIPFAAAVWPIWRGTSVPVREAISSYGIANYQGSRIDMLLETMMAKLTEQIKYLSRLVLLSIKNTFRRKGRLILTLCTLTTAGAIAISVASVNQSLRLTVDDLFEYFNYDIGVFFTKVQRIDKIEQEALRVAGVTGVESWGYSNGRILKNGKDENDSVRLDIYAPNADTKMIKPLVVNGRWLIADDENALVVNTDVIKKLPDLKIGDKLTLKLDGRKNDWIVVGVVKSIMTGPMGYINRPYFNLITREVGRASSVQISLNKHDSASQTEIAKNLERSMKLAGLRIGYLQTTQVLKDQINKQFGVITIFLFVMAILLVIVGGLGLAGTMSMNVAERTREIGVMRAIGASDRALLQLIMAEGLFIGILSWGLAVIFALPISKLLSDNVGELFIQTPLTFEFSIIGAIIWLFIVLIIAAISTWWPARMASKISVREALSYE